MERLGAGSAWAASMSRYTCINIFFISLDTGLGAFTAHAAQFSAGDGSSVSRWSPVPLERNCVQGFLELQDTYRPRQALRTSIKSEFLKTLITGL